MIISKGRFGEVEPEVCASIRVVGPYFADAMGHVPPGFAAWMAAFPVSALPRWRFSMRRSGFALGVVQNPVPSCMNSGRFAWMMPLRCWMGSLRVRMYLG